MSRIIGEEEKVTNRQLNDTKCRRDTAITSVRQMESTENDRIRKYKHITS